MERNLLLAVALSMGVYVAWFSLVERRFAPPVPASDGVLRPPQSGSAPASTALKPAQAPAPSARPKPQFPAEALALAAPFAKAEFSSSGAALSSYRYEDPLGPVELVPQGGPGFLATWPDLFFAPVKARWPGALALEAEHPAGFRVRKEFRFAPEGELSLLRVEFKNPGRKSVSVPAWELSLGPGLGTVPSEEKENAGLLRALALTPPPVGKKKERLEKLGPDSETKDWKWLGLDNRYFILALWPEREAFSGYKVSQAGKDKAPLITVAANPETLGPGAASGHDIPFYLGPKPYFQLKAMNLGLERAVDYGWFDAIALPILKLLHYLQRKTGNYGWAIILLTVLLQACLFPLTLKGLKAQAAMKRIQPEVARVQQKYSKDPQRLNQELMALYRSKGANPLGGCLPMLLQLPIFVALFNALRNSWELHGSPWIGWIHDLSAKDPYYVLPLIMGGVMFAQTKFTQQPAADPTQAQIMTFMPVIMTFMFLNFPSGLVLYWLTSSILNTSQQLVLQAREKT